MVQSHTTSLTPAQHAANHIHGASDPLSGDVRSTYVKPHAADHIVGGSDHVVLYTLSADVISASATQKSTMGAGYTKIKESVYHGGSATVRIAYTYYKRTSAVTGYRLYINGVAAGTENLPGSGSNTWFESSEDFAVVEGDLIQVYAKTDGSGAEVAAAKDFELRGVPSIVVLGATAQDP